MSRADHTTRYIHVLLAVRVCADPSDFVVRRSKASARNYRS